MFCGGDLSWVVSVSRTINSRCVCVCAVGFVVDSDIRLELSVIKVVFFGVCLICHNV